MTYQKMITVILWSTIKSFPGGSDGKKSACNAGDPGSIPGLGRSPGERNVNPLQHSCLENAMNRVVWQATAHVVAVRHNWATFTYIQLKVCSFKLYTENSWVLICAHNLKIKIKMVFLGWLLGLLKPVQTRVNVKLSRFLLCCESPKCDDLSSHKPKVTSIPQRESRWREFTIWSS